MNDTYTKTMLTLIAIFLGILCLKDLPILPSAQAADTGKTEAVQEKPLAVRIVNEPRVFIRGVAEGIETELPVRVVQPENAPYDVRIHDVTPNIFNRLPVEAK